MIYSPLLAMKFKKVIKGIVKGIVIIFGTTIVLILTGIIPYSDAILGDGYYYMSLDESIDIGYPEQIAFIYVGSERYVFDDIKIKGNIVQVKKNKKFIVVSMLENKNAVQCFIIKKKGDVIFGPLTVEEYKTKAQDLEIPRKLTCVKG